MNFEINKIYNEDCFETMKQMPKIIDLILTSPPYNMTKRNGGYADKTKRYDVYEDWKEEDNYIEWTIDLFNLYDKVLKENKCILYNFSYSIENPSLPYKLISEICKKTSFTVVDTIIWKKSTSIPYSASQNRLRRICEFIFVISRKNEINTFETNKSFTIGKNGQRYYDIIDNYIEAINNDGVNNLNKATFSSQFVRKLLKIYARPNSIIYDSFIGTGTTAEACIIENMNFIGSELSKAQCDFANKRLKIRTLQPTLF